MIISPGRKYVFVHIPKTGGTSLSLALEERAMKNDILIGDTPKALRRRERVKTLKSAGRLWKHSKLADIEGLLSDEQISDYFVVTLVRNPWDRYVSYFHWLREQTFDHAAVKIAKNNDFSAFLNHPQTKLAAENDSYASYVTCASGAERCNLFVRLEHLNEDIQPFERHLGFELRDIEHANASNREKDYRPHYSDNDQELVAAWFAKDTQRFGYSF